MKLDNKQKIILGSLIGIILGSVVSVTYAFFSYSATGANQQLIAGDIYLRYQEANGITLSNMLPSSTYPNEYFEFTVTGKNTNTQYDVEYNLKLAYGDAIQGKTRVNDSHILFKLVEVVNNEEQALNPEVEDQSFNEIPGSTIYTGKIAKNTTNQVTHTYRLYMRISNSVTIGNGDVDYQMSDWNNRYASIKINADGGLVTTSSIVSKVMSAADAKSSVSGCTNGTYFTEDGITYFSGTNTCIDFNYVWYSGKLWRITSIDSTGNMKLITEDAITAINWGSTIEFNGSWVYQWLNEDFYDTLVDADDYIIQNASWNYSTDGNSTPVKPTTIEPQATTTANVGLLSAYEYLKAYANASTSTNFLNIGYYWWLITPYSSSYVRYVGNGGSLGNGSPASYARGVRPSIYLKSGISMTGLGSKSNPYRINDADLESAKPGDLLSSRMAGEYVNFDNDLYRIVSTENSITKLTRVDYLRDETSNDTPKPVINKNFASTAYFGKSTNTGDDTYWDYYLNNTWYANISSPYKGMVTNGIFYLGLYAGSGKHYKITICSDTASTLDSKITKLGVEGKSCTRYPTNSNDPAYDVNKIFVGKVGLLRVGEMFSAQLGSGSGSSSDMWLVTPYSSSGVRYVSNDGYLYNTSPASFTRGVRPTINLASGVTITGGTGLEGSPYEITYTPSP